MSSHPPTTPPPPPGPKTPPPPASPKKGDSGPRALATTEQVSEYLGVPVNTLYQWRRLHKGPKGARIGRHVKYRWADVEAWFEAQAVSA